MTEGKTLLDKLEPLIEQVESRTQTLAMLKEQSMQARLAETQAITRLNGAQRQLDTAIRELQKSADPDTDWGRTTYSTFPVPNKKDFEQL